MSSLKSKKGEREHCIHCGKTNGHFKTCLAYTDSEIYIRECGYTLFSFTPRKFLGGIFRTLVIKGNENIYDRSGTSYMIPINNLIDFILENNL
jgi:hypothetical protein